MSPETRARILSPETLIPVGVLMALLGPLIGCTWYAAITYSSLQRTMIENTQEIAQLKLSINKNQWSYQMQRSLWRQFATANKGANLWFPDPKNIFDDYQ